MRVDYLPTQNLRQVVSKTFMTRYGCGNGHVPHKRYGAVLEPEPQPSDATL